MIKSLLLATAASLAFAQSDNNFLGPFNGTYPYAVHVPSNATAGALPVMVFLHGSGSKGDVSQVLDHAGWDGSGLLIREGGNNRSHVMARDSFITFIPVLPTSDDLWSADSVMSTFASFVSSPPAPLTTASFDLSRLYASGYSLGGSGTWDLIRYYSGNFSAALVGSGGPIGLSDSDYKKIASDGVAVWGFAGSIDKGTLEQDVSNAISSLQQNGGNAKFTVIEGADHHIESWAPWEYNDGESFDFLLSYSKNSTSSPVAPSLSIEPVPVSTSFSSAVAGTTSLLGSIATPLPPVTVTVTL